MQQLLFGGDRLLQLLKKILRPFDCLILVAAVILFINFDYSNLQTVDIIYMITFAIWFVLLLIRGYIIWSDKGGDSF